MDHDDDDFPLAVRAAKRRRIEKLADGFLNGFPLEIHSARMDPQAFTKHIAWSFSRPKTAWRAMTEAGSFPAPVGGWEEVDDDWQFFQRQSVEHDLSEVPSFQDEVIVEIQQSSCHRRRSRRLVKLALDPSKDALRKAAELRNRKLAAIRATVVEESLPQSCPMLQVEDSQVDLELNSTGSTTYDSYEESGPSPTPAWTSAKWRETGLFKPRSPRKPVNQDCSRDELGISSFSIPSQRARTHATSKRVAERDAGTQQSQPACHSTIEENSKNTSNESNVSDSASAAETVAFETAPEEAAEHLISNAAQVEGQVEDESQTFGSRQANGSRPSKKARAVKSAGGTPLSGILEPPRRSNRRKSAPSESQMNAIDREILPDHPKYRTTRARAQYTESVPSKDASPFMFRKRKSKLDHSVGPVETVTPLVNEHLNRILPTEKSSGKSSRSLRSSLKAEMLASGAKLSKAPGEHSSQPEPDLLPVRNDPATTDEEHDGMEESQHGGNMPSLPELPKPESQQNWPSTQALLAKAQRDLFTSPEKEDSNAYLGDATTPRVQSQGEKNRRPLQSLSQEPAPLPSTQQLMEAWPGWSSVKKKPKNLDENRILAASPTVTRDDRAIGKTRRKSSLRYSLTLSQDSRIPASLEQPPSMLSLSTALVPATSSRNTAHSFPKPSGKIASSLSFGSISFAVIKPSSQNQAQVRDTHDAFVAPIEPSSQHPSPTKEPSNPYDELDVTTADISFTIPSQLGVGPPVPSTLVPASTLGDMSFGPPAIASQSTVNDATLGNLSFGATATEDDLPSHLKQNAQQQDFNMPRTNNLLESYDSQDLELTVNEVVRGVLEETASFSF